MVVNNAKIYQKTIKSWLKIKKTVQMKKHFIIIKRNYFHSENLVYYLQVFLRTDLNKKKLKITN